MAENILRLKVDSQEYDNKIKRAAEGIQRYAQKCREAGGTLEFLDDGVLSFVQALGKMDTVSTSTKQQVRELSNALTTLTMTYRSLTEEEKASPFGQELAKGIQQLTERAGQAKDAMMDVEISIKNAASDTRLFDQMAQGMSVATAGFQGLTGAGKLLGIEMGNDVEIIAKLQAAMAVTNSLTTIQTALQKESALMMGIVSVQTKAASIAQSLLAKETIAATAAAKVFNLVAKANPIGLLVTGVTTAIGAFTLLSSAFGGAKDEAEKLAKAEEEAKRKQDEYNKSLKDAAQNVIGNLYGKFITLRAEWNKLSDDASRTQWIKENTNAFKELGATISSISDAEDIFARNSDAMVQAIMLRAQAAVLTKKIEKALENVSLEDNTPPPPSNRSVGNNDSDPYSSNSFSYDTPYQTAPDSGSRFNQMVARHYADELAEVNMQLDELMKKYKKNGGGTGGSGGSIVTQKELTETQQLQANIASLTKEYQQLSDVEKVADVNTVTGIEMRKAAIRGEIQSNQQRIDELKKFADEAKNVLPKNQEATFKLTVDKSKLDSLQASIAKFGDKSIKVNVEQGSIDLPDVPTDDETIKVNVEQGTIDLPNVPTDDETIKVNVEPGELNIPEVPEQYTMTITADTTEALQKVQGLVKDVDGRTLTFKTKVDLETGISGTNESSISEYVKNLQKELADIDYSVAGSFQKALDINSNIIDANTLGNLLKTSIQQGIDLAAAGIDVESIFEKITSGEGLEDADWKGFVDKINEQLKNQGIKISIDTDTGNISSNGKEKSNPLLYTREDGKTELKTNETLGSLAGGLSNVASGLEDLGVKIPEGIKSVISGMQSISTILTGIATTILAIQAISTASLFKPFARGGIIGKAAGGMLIPGNSFSGDNLRLPVDNGGGWIGVNSGELILNQSQQGNLASQLQDGMRGNGFNTQPYVYAEQIWLGLENMLKRQGRGEIVTTKG